MATERMKAILDKDASLAQIRRKKYQALTASPVEAQVAFLKELSRDEDEIKKFMEDPRKYTSDRNITLDPETVKEIVDSTLIDIEFSDAVRAKLGENAIKDIVDMRADVISGTRANVAAAAAVAAVVVMAATLVISLTRSNRTARLSELKNIRGTDIRLPKGATFKARDITK